MAASSHSRDNIPLLEDADDYPNWRRRIKAVLMTKDIDVDHCTDAQKKKMYAYLVMGLGDAVADTVLNHCDEDDGPALWTVLSEHLGASTPLRVQSALLALLGPRGDLSYVEYLDFLEAQRGILVAGKNLEALNVPVLIAHVSRELGKDFASVALPHVKRSADDASWSAFVKDVRDAIPFIEPPPPVPAAFRAASHGTTRGRGRGSRGRGSRRGGRGGGGVTICYHCGSEGHIKRNCPKIGGQITNTAACGCVHGATCTAASVSAAPAPSTVPGRGNTSASAAHSKTGGPRFHAPTCAFIAMAARVDRKLYAAVDSGANTHVLNDPSFFVHLKPCEQELELATGIYESVGGVGTAVVILESIDGARVQLTLHDTLLITGPKSYNLISHSRLRHAGHRVLDRDEGLVMSFKEGAQVLAKEYDGLFFAQIHPESDGPLQRAAHAAATGAPPEEAQYVSPSASTAEEMQVLSGVSPEELQHLSDRLTPEELHRLLGHISGDLMRRLGLPVPTSFCDVCALAKSVRQPISREPVMPAAAPGDKAHLDLCGPFSPSLDRGAYAFAITDDATRYTWVQILRRKSDAPAALTSVLRELGQLGITLRHLHADNDAVFRGSAFQDLLAQHGIRFSSSPPYTPALNGVAERKWRTLLGLTRALLLDAGLPDSYWGAAMKHAVLIMNAVPLKSESHLSPFERIHGRRFDLSRLRPFGARAFVDAVSPRKLSPQASAGIYIGHSLVNDSAVVRLDTGSIVETMHLRVDPARRAPPADQEETISGQEETMFMTVGPTAAPTAPHGVDISFSDSDHDTVDEDGGTNVDEGHATAAPPPAAPTFVPPPPHDPTARPDENPDGSWNIHCILQERKAHNKKEYLVHWLGYPDNEATWEPAKNLAHTDALRNWQLALDGAALPPAAVTNENEHITVVGSDTSSEDDEDSLITLVVYIPKEPTSLIEALATPESEQWMVSVEEELGALEANGTWHIVDKLPPGRRAIDTKFIFKVKKTANGEPLRLKVRLVAKGFMQREGQDYFELFSPVVQRNSLRILMAIAATLGWHMHAVDIKTAFLQGELMHNEEIYIRLPAELSNINDERSSKLCRLDKPLYGLKQAPRAWWSTLDKALSQLGFARTDADPSVYTGQIAGFRIALAIWVDDILIISPSQDAVEAVKKSLATHFECRDLGAVDSFVGINVERGELTTCLNLHGYIHDLLIKFGMNKSKATRSPLPAKWQTHLAKAGQPLSPGDCTKYREIVGALLYCATTVRPDLAFAASALAQLLQAPTDSAFTAAKHTLRYLNGTRKLGLTFIKTTGQSLDVTAYSDATFASEKDAKSISGFVILYNGTATSWMCRKQSTVSTSTQESEYVAMCEAAREIAFQRRLLAALHVDPIGPITLYCDNQPALHLAENHEVTARSKHIKVAYHFVRQCIDENLIHVEYIPTTDQLADGMTKAIDVTRFIAHRNVYCGE